MRKNIFSNHTLLFVLRLVIGTLFVIASIGKITDPDHFKIIVSEYGMLPNNLVPVFAVILPWIELVVGLMFMLNQYSKSTALIIISMLMVFIVAVVINMSRGVSSDCGCFDLLGFSEKTGSVVIIRDLLMIIMTVPVLLFDSNRFMIKIKKS